MKPSWSHVTSSVCFHWWWWWSWQRQTVSPTHLPAPCSYPFHQCHCWGPKHQPGRNHLRLWRSKGHRSTMYANKNKQKNILLREQQLKSSIKHKEKQQDDLWLREKQQNVCASHVTLCFSVPSWTRVLTPTVSLTEQWGEVTLTRGTSWTPQVIPQEATTLTVSWALSSLRCPTLCAMPERLLCEHTQLMVCGQLKCVSAGELTVFTVWDVDHSKATFTRSSPTENGKGLSLASSKYDCVYTDNPKCCSTHARPVVDSVTL